MRKWESKNQLSLCGFDRIQVMWVEVENFLRSWKFRKNAYEASLLTRLNPEIHVFYRRWILKLNFNNWGELYNGELSEAWDSWIYHETVSGSWKPCFSCDWPEKWYINMKSQRLVNFWKKGLFHCHYCLCWTPIHTNLHETNTFHAWESPSNLCKSKNVKMHNVNLNKLD